MAQLRHDYSQFVAREIEVVVVGPENARASQPMPSAMARATAAVLPHSDSYTTIAFISRPRALRLVS